MILKQLLYLFTLTADLTANVLRNSILLKTPFTFIHIFDSGLISIIKYTASGFRSSSR